MRRTTVLFLTLILVTASLMTGYAQVTTSSIGGVVKGEKGDLLAGATITVTHEPTGSVFTAQSRNGGRFDIQNVPPGGPFTIKASFVGYSPFTRSDVNIPLGEKFEIQIVLSASTQELTSVVVAARRGVNEKTGAATNISRRLIATIPNVNRTLAGLTKITPQSNGNSFAGMNYRYNNITVDGSLFNNNFGRSGDGQVPGGASAAISLDAIDQVQVNISPYDVRQAGFVGAGINAVTRRGTNNWYGTVYGYYRNQDFNGTKVAGITVPNVKRSNQIFGASVGGPIIENKLFFFVNFETEKRTAPPTAVTVARRPGNENDPNVSPVNASDLDDLKAFLIKNYGYDPGAYEGYDFKTDNTKFTGRLDWNITSKHRLTARYTQSETNDDDQVNSSSGPPSPAPRINNGRRGGKSGGITYFNTNFKNNTKVKSGVLELNSNFSNIVSNQLIGSYTRIQPVRVPYSSFPFVDIMRAGDPNNVYISLGTDLFSYKNEIDDKALNIADNVTLNLGKHTVTAGVNFDYMAFANSFAAYGGPSYYRYASLADFMNNANVAPVAFGVSYSNTDRLGITPAEAKFAQLGIYAQDAWAINPKFKLTYGLRVDLPFYPYTPAQNPALAAVTFKNPDGIPENFDVSKWPKKRPLFSPRVGFTYDPEGDKSIVVRGGTGIFTGRIPFIWLVNQVGDNGVLRSIYQPTGSALAAIRFDPDRAKYIPTTIDPPGTTIPAGRPSYSATAPDFKMPQTWRSNLAVDKRLSTNLVLTVEAIITKMINNAYYRNANLGGENGKYADGRPTYNSRLNDNISQMIVLDNTSKGFSSAFTAQLQKTFAHGWEAGIAYTYTFAQDLAIGTSDQAGSGWTTNNIVMNANKPELGYSNFSIPHRIVANGSYRFEYANKKLATTIGLYYSAQPQERFHYRYGGDINGDGATNDMIFIPNDPTTLKFQAVYTPVAGGPSYTAAQQSLAFAKFVENDKYLSKHKGQYIERYGALLPWYHSLDLRLLQDFSLRTGTRSHTLQFSVDLINALNLLNSNWGHRYRYNFGTFQDQGILGIGTGSTAANPVYTFDPSIWRAYSPEYNTNSTWGIQLGLRYIFN